MKIIYLEPDEEITSIVDMLTESEAQEIALVMPLGAQLLQSSISLKLLKREANNLRKKVIIVTADRLGQQIAENAKFEVRDKINENEIKEFSPEFTKSAAENEDQDQPPSKEDMIDALVEEMEIEKDDQLSDDKKEISQNQPVAQTVAAKIAVKGNKGKTAKLSDIVKLRKIDSSDDAIRKQIKSKIKSEIETNYKKDETNIDADEPIAFQQDQSALQDDTDSSRLHLSDQKLQDGFESIEDLESPLADEQTDQPANDFEALKKELRDDDKFEETELESDVKNIKSQPIKIKKSFLKKILTSKIFYIAVASVLVVGSALAYSALPTAEIIIEPKTERISLDLQVTGSIDAVAVDMENKKIPVQLLKAPKDLIKEFPSSGEKQLDTKAKGKITVYNEYSSKPQVLVATTRFLSADGKVFRLIETTEVPGATIDEGRILASTLEVEIEAEESGEEYNIGPSEFTIPGFKGTPKYAGFYAKSSESMSGGSTRIVKVVTAEDLEKAEDVLTAQLLDQGLAKAELESQMPEKLKMIEGAFKEDIVSVTSDAETDDEKDKFTMTVTALSQMLLFDESHLNEIVNQQISSKIEENRIPLPASQQIVSDVPDIDWESGTVVMNLTVQEDIAWDIDKERIKDELAGKNEVEAKKYLINLRNLKKAKVTFWPFWIHTIPEDKTRIEVKVE